MRKVNLDNASSTPNSIPFNGTMPGMGNMFGNMMNNMMGNMNQVSEAIDVEAAEVHNEVEDNSTIIEEKPEEGFIMLKTATPFNISINEKNNKKIATVYYLCRDIDDKLFMLDRNFILDTEDDILSIELLPFTEDLETDFASDKIVAHTLNAYLPAYITNMEFYVDEGFEKETNPTVYLYGTNIKTKESKKIKMPADIFACINFVDSYIFDTVDCEHDLALATVAGSKVLDTPAQFFLVDKVDSIISMANAVIEPEKKGLAKIFNRKKQDAGTTIGIVMKVNKFISNTEKEVASILTPFDVGVTYDSSKFRGKKIEDIQNEYYGDADQYVATLTTTNTRLHGVDKEYMIIRGKTKDMKVRLFLFDSSMQEELKHLIDLY